ncbi:endolytic transglycosylase MltG [Oryzobacter telluris]|uniref:endolytic transglycosylase MltG n=1 Tax=Oryzobacter telluris TaxID=3149179 RepID=UPI00370D0F82
MTHQHDFTDTIFGGSEPEPETRRARTRAELHRGRAPRKGPRRWIILLLAIVLVGGGAWAAVGALAPMVSGLLGGSSQAEDFPGPGEGAVTVTVEPGQTGEDIATTLRDLGVVKTRSAYLEAAAGDPSAAAAIQPGSYALLKGMRGADAFETLSDPANRVVARTTIREGLWANEVYATLSKGTGIPVKEYQAAAKDTAAIGLPKAAKGKVEGWLHPLTYEFPDGSTAKDQLKTMVAATVKALEDAKVPEDEWMRTLTIASIVEGEVNGDADRAKVARVILNRLEGGPPSYGLLQMDSTVHFVAQERGRAGTTNAQRDSDSPYNTYKVQGLPPGPIDSPGTKSIEAAANPAKGGWYFFVTVDPSTGETKFAETVAEHDRNVQEFQAWCRANKDKC